MIIPKTLEKQAQQLSYSTKTLGFTTNTGFIGVFIAQPPITWLFFLKAPPIITSL